MKQVKRKLCSPAGETISEVLIALLISTLALMILAGMISATAGVVKTSSEKMETYYSENAKLEEIGTDKTAKLTITVSGGSATTTITDIDIAWYSNDTLNTVVTAYRSVG